MDQKWIQILVILVFYASMTSGISVTEVKEGQSHEITCHIASTCGNNMIIWFRILGDSNMEFIGSFGKDGTKRSTSSPIPTGLDIIKIKDNILTVKSFSKTRDSGTYTCSCIKSNELKFGQLTHLSGEKVIVPTKAPEAAVTKPVTIKPTTPKSCVCENKNGLSCSMIILGPLAGGCGLLLLLLIVTILYCNRIRTRRCPHHHKRKPRPMAPGKQMIPNTHI